MRTRISVEEANELIKAEGKRITDICPVLELYFEMDDTGNKDEKQKPKIVVDCEYHRRQRRVPKEYRLLFTLCPQNRYDCFVLEDIEKDK